MLEGGDFRVGLQEAQTTRVLHNGFCRESLFDCVDHAKLRDLIWVTAPAEYAASAASDSESAEACRQSKQVQCLIGSRAGASSKRLL